MIGFTAYSSGKPPDVVISMLRDLLHFLSEAVFSNQGSVDKYLGDGLMGIFWPTPDEPARCHKRGLCVLEIVKSIECWSQHYTRCDEGTVRIAVGIHYGEVVQGNVGSEKRLELTLVGDTGHHP